MKNSVLVLPFVFISWVFVSPAYALTIGNVVHSVHDDYVEIRFTLSESSVSTVLIYDDRDYLIRTIEQTEEVESDAHVRWDYKDDNGEYVPDQAYKYVITAVDSNANAASQDLSDITGTSEQEVKSVIYRKDEGVIEFFIDKPSRVLIRAGLKGGGPLMSTISNWREFQYGLNRITWDGMDMSGEIGIGEHENVYFATEAYELSDNSIIVDKTGSRGYIDLSSLSGETRAVSPIKKRMLAAYQLPAESRGDYPVELEILNPQGMQNRAPVVSGEVHVRLSVDGQYEPLLVNRRSEPVYYIDGRFAYENEVGFYPMVWNLDTSNITDGVHYLTVNVRGYEGNFGIATQRIIVDND